MRYRGAITVGGKNSRMNGFPKGTIRLNGMRLFDHVREALEPIVSKVVVSVHEEIPLELPDDTPIIRDHYSEKRCSMNAVYSILRDRAEPTIIVPWDMPFVTDHQLQHLLDEDSGKTTGGVFYRMDRIIQPFPGLYRPSLLEPLKNALETENFSLRNVLQDQSIELMSVPQDLDPTHFKSLNSPRDLKDLIQEIS